MEKYVSIAGKISPTGYNPETFKELIGSGLELKDGKINVTGAAPDDLWKRIIKNEDPSHFTIGGYNRGSTLGSITVQDLFEIISRGNLLNSYIENGIYYGLYDDIPTNKDLVFSYMTNEVRSVMLRERLDTGVFAIFIPENYTLSKLIDDTMINIASGLNLKSTVVNNNLYRVFYTNKLKYNDILEVTADFKESDLLPLQLKNINIGSVMKGVLFNNCIFVKAILDNVKIKGSINTALLYKVSFVNPIINNVKIVLSINTPMLNNVILVKPIITSIDIKKSIQDPLLIKVYPKKIEASDVGFRKVIINNIFINKS